MARVAVRPIVPLFCGNQLLHAGKNGAFGLLSFGAAAASTAWPDKFVRAEPIALYPSLFAFCLPERAMRIAYGVHVAAHNVCDVNLEVPVAIRTTTVCMANRIVQTVQRRKHHARSPPKSMVALRVDEARPNMGKVSNRDRPVHENVRPQLDDVIERR
eukprot:CAMPEP_0179054926 /NCGR_PEP_ID=MMETSP0796-20121207/23038_1 /TAXON_ID=73915 /ORGANISM="Pyrodinium bahamense, Strain pbaha01" /LENGTH=157 /DNA_ID=CAMNT_0020751565 /DNA_START=235 /DNA_END=708 /DNA_ORIENTATION=-